MLFDALLDTRPLVSSKRPVRRRSYAGNDARAHSLRSSSVSLPASLVIHSDRLITSRLGSSVISPLYSPIRRLPALLLTTLIISALRLVLLGDRCYRLRV